MATEKPEPDLVRPSTSASPDTQQDTEPDASAPGVRSGGMSAQAIRDAGYAIDMPMELPDTDFEGLRYGPAAEGREEWTPPEGFTMGGIPWNQLPPVGEETEPPPDASPPASR